MQLATIYAGPRFRMLDTTLASAVDLRRIGVPAQCTNEAAVSVDGRGERGFIRKIQRLLHIQSCPLGESSERTRK